MIIWIIFDTFGENFDLDTFKNDTFKNDTFESVRVDAQGQSHNSDGIQVPTIPNMYLPP